MNPEVFSKYLGIELERYLKPNYSIYAKNVFRNRETFLEINSNIMGHRIIIHSMESGKRVYPNPDYDIYIDVVDSLHQTIETYDFENEDDVITFKIPQMVENILEEYQDVF